MALREFFILLTVLAACYAGKLTVSHAPDSLRFSEGNPLWMSSLDDLLAAAMGYTPKTTPWSGMTITNPFDAPIAAVVVGVEGSGSDVLQEGIRYSLQEDQSFNSVFATLKSAVQARAQRPTYFHHMEVADGASDFIKTSASNSALQATRQPDAAFLQEISALPLLPAKLELNTSTSHGGQDFIFYQIESFALLVKTYGDDSAEVQEGKQLLRDGIGRLVAGVRALYGDRVLVLSALLDKPSLTTVFRRTRSVLQTPSATVNLNLATEYSEDYPAIFNIILFMSIVLLLAILGASLSMAYMDPGRDSIIYRMSNPRMKKDQ